MKKSLVYTKTGDKGTTGLYTGERVPKQSLRVEAYGTVDEISSALGLARAQVTREDVRETIFNVQKLLMSVMADIASLNLPEPYIKEEHVKLFEDTIDKFDSLLQPDEKLRQLQDGANFTEKMVLMEEAKTLPFGDVWAEYCRRQGVPADGDWYAAVTQYEKEVLSRRG